jgi:hypothetical protein
MEIEERYTKYPITALSPFKDILDDMFKKYKTGASDTLILTVSI